MKKLSAVIISFALTVSLFGCGTKVESVGVHASEELAVGATETIEATIAPEDATDKTLTYTSSNPDVATVDENGKIVAVSVGETKIKVQSSNKDVFTEYTLNVIIPVESIAFKEAKNYDGTELAMIPQSKLPAEAEVLPADATNKEITYSSSDESVATIDEKGEITGIAVGTTTITATSENGKETSITVLVQTPVEGIAIEQQNISTPMDESVQLTVLYTPKNAEWAKELTWTTEDANVAIVDENGKVTGVNVGKTTITATTSGGFTATTEVTTTKKVVAATKSATANKNTSTGAAANNSGVRTGTTGGTTGGNTGGGTTTGGNTGGSTNTGGTTGGNAGNTGGAVAQPALDTSQAINAGIAYANSLPYVKGVGSSMPSYNFGIVVSQETSQAELNSRVCQQVDMAYATLMSGVNKLIANGVAPEDIPISEIGIWFDGNAINVGW